MPELADEGSVNINQTVAKLLRFVTRRRWWVLLPFFAISLTSVVVLSVLPNRYTSTATLLVVQQQVPERYVVPNSDEDLVSALQAMKQEILSRTQLLRMINEFGLYQKERKRYAPEQLVDLMSNNIKVAPTIENPLSRQTKDFDAFTVSFTAENALVAQQITNNLTSLFTDAYLRSRTEQANNTTDFLHRQVVEKGKELEAQETKLRDFKLSHVGELPEQQPANLGILTGLQNRLSNTMTSLENAQQQRALLQAQFDATPRRRQTSDGSAPVFIPGLQNSNQSLGPVQVAQNELALLEAERNKLRLKHYTDEHPDVVKIRQAIAEAREKLKLAKASLPLPEAPASAIAGRSQPVPVLDPTDDPVITQLKSSLEGNRVQIENLKRDEARLKGEITQYEARINQMPVREQQEAGLLRDTEVLRQEYGNLQKKEQDSQLATNLEKQQGGQQFRLIDPASLPVVPSWPKRTKMSLGGVAAGFAIGFGLAVLMEMRDTSYRTEFDLTKHLTPPFVLGIPLLQTPKEKRRDRARNLLQWATASTMIIMVMAAELYVYRRG